MIKTIEIAPYIFVDSLLNVIYDSLYNDIEPDGAGYINVDGAALKKRFLEAMGVDSDLSN